MIACAAWLTACVAPTTTVGPDAGDDAAVVRDASRDAHDGCSADVECDDGLFCNGAEHCAAADAGARRCMPGTAACTSLQSCDESLDLCLPPGCEHADADGDGVRSIACGGDDCDDGDADRFSGHPERCDPFARLHDEDCDPCTFVSADGDGDVDHDGALSLACGNTFDPMLAAPVCDAATSRVDDALHAITGTDCDDMSADTHPGAIEACNLIDDDCDGLVDEGAGRAFYPDADGDRYGDASAAPVLACGPPAGYVEDHTDCDDTTRARNPGNAEICDGLDNDCACDASGRCIDEGTVATVYYRDADLDGHGDPSRPTPGTSCDPPSGQTLAPGADDCNDTNAAVYPGAPELCDRLDDACLLPAPGTGGVAVAEDVDDDGHAPPSATCGGGFPRDDCDDTDARAYPGASERCDGIDDDCDASIDESPEAGRLCAPQSSCEAAACTHVAGVELGQNHSCVVLAGAIWCWGANESGQLGDGTTTMRSTAVPGPTLAGVVQLAAGLSHTCARLADGTVWCWGGNASRQLGDGTAVNRTTPVQVVGLSDVIEIASGSRHVCARQTSGTVQCWGAGANGRLGDDTTSDRGTPGPVSGLSDAVELAAEGGSTCARRAGGSIVCWGLNDTSQIGDGTTIDRSTPTPVAIIDDAIDIDFGNRHGCARRASGAVTCWGGWWWTTIVVATPTDIPGFAGALEVSAGYLHTCARMPSGQVVCVGRDDNDQLGDGTYAFSSTPVAVPGVTDAVGMDAGLLHTCARRTAGGVVCWGDDTYGQCGGGTVIAFAGSPPVDVMGLP